LDFGAGQNHLFGLGSPGKLTIQDSQRQISLHQFEIDGVVNN
jgi:hypothetical protein